MAPVNGVDNGKAGYGVRGGSGSGVGVRGRSDLGIGVDGGSDKSAGVYGHSTEKSGVLGQSSHWHGVVGTSAARPSDRDFAGVYGGSDPRAGLYSKIGVWGRSDPDEGGFEKGYGVIGRCTGDGYGVYGSGATGPGVFGTSDHGLAGKFKGDVEVTGKLDVKKGVFDGDVEVTGNLNVAKDILLTGADCAEDFDSSEGESIEAGTVVVIDQSGGLQPSQDPYDKKVAGVVSGAGDFRPGLVLDRQESRVGRIPVALVGKVECKVDADHSPIEVGDLLTTSPTSGHAMKADEPLKAFGAVIGKALRPLDSGRRLIPILIALQ